MDGSRFQERQGMGGHELNSGSFTRDWRRVNAMVHSLLRPQRNLPEKKRMREKSMTM
jgi:hypothetical protein